MKKTTQTKKEEKLEEEVIGAHLVTSAHLARLAGPTSITGAFASLQIEVLVLPTVVGRAGRGQRDQLVEQKIPVVVARRTRRIIGRF